MKYGLLALLLALLMGSSFYLAQPAEVVLFGLAGVVFILPGVVLGRYFWGNRPETYFFGSVWGILISAFSTVAMTWLFGWNLLIQLGAILLLSLGFFYLTRKRRATVFDLKRWQDRDWMVLLTSLILVTFFLLIPFHNLGRLTAQGYAFPSLFGHDFMIRSSIAASLSQTIPPHFLPFSGQILDNYYWLSYLLPATVYRILGPAYSMHHILTLTVIFYSLLFVGVLWSCLRIFLPDFKARVWCLGLAFLAYNFYWIYVVLRNDFQNLPLELGSLLAKYQLLGHSDISHAWLRDLIFEPQAILALSALFTLVGMNHLSKETLRANPFLSGLLLILIFATDSFIGLIGILWYLSFLGLQFVFQKQRVIRLKQIAVALIPIILIYILYLKMQMYSLGKSSSSVVIQPYWLVLIFLPVYLLLEYGLLAIFGVPGLVVKAREHFHLVILALWCIIFILLVQLSIENDVVIRKGQKILQFPLLVFTGLALSSLMVRQKKKLLSIGLPLLAVLALPSLFFDLKASSDISDPGNVTFISAEDFQACLWLKKNTPAGSIIQSAPQYEGGKYELSLIALLAERQMVIGEWKVSRMQVVNDTSLLWRRYRDVDSIFASSNLEQARNLIKKYGINYVYVGPRERMLYSPGYQKFSSDPEEFEPIYTSGGVVIYQVRQDERKSRNLGRHTDL